MIDERFSPEAFEQAAAEGKDALNAILQDLEAELAAAMQPAAEAAMAEVGAALNALGHELGERETEFFDESLSFFDAEWAQGDPERGDLRLWVSMNCVSAAGYAGLPRDEGEDDALS